MGECKTEWVEECINENEEVCEELNECIEPQGPCEVITEHHSYTAPARSSTPEEGFHYITSATPQRSSVSVAQDISTLPRVSDLVESKSQRLQNLFQQVSQGFQSKRSVAEALELLDDAEKQEMADALDVPVSKLSELSEEIADSEKDHHTEEGNSRQKRGLLGLHFLKKHLVGKVLAPVVVPPVAAGIAAGNAARHIIGKKVAAKAIIGTGVGLGAAAKVQTINSLPKTVVHSSPKTAVHSVPRTVDVVEKCRNVNKCYQRPVTKCQETPVESCWDEPRESCKPASSQRCFTEPKEVCRPYPEENCVRSGAETCWDEPREQCTEQRVKVARKWCHVEEPITGNEVW